MYLSFAAKPDSFVTNFGDALPYRSSALDARTSGSKKKRPGRGAFSESDRSDLGLAGESGLAGKSRLVRERRAEVAVGRRNRRVVAEAADPDLAHLFSRTFLDLRLLFVRKFDPHFICHFVLAFCQGDIARCAPCFE